VSSLGLEQAFIAITAEDDAQAGNGTSGSTGNRSAQPAGKEN